MSYSCRLCKRYFITHDALQQHVEDSPAHGTTFLCMTCNRLFVSDEALTQHLRDSPAHRRSFFCETCNRSFQNELSLEQHLRDSYRHGLAFECATCHRMFESKRALDLHLQYSPLHLHEPPAHIQRFHCRTCRRNFVDEQALTQHLRDSAVHAASSTNKSTNQPITNQQATGQGTRESISHGHRETPLDVFFDSFPSFEYDPSLQPAESYAQLRKQEGWQEGSAASNDAWERYQDALEDEIRMWYGAEASPAALYMLCDAMGIDPLPLTRLQCEEALHLCKKALLRNANNDNRLLDASEKSDSEQSDSEKNDSENCDSDKSVSDKSVSEQSGSEESGSEECSCEESGSEKSGSEGGNAKESVSAFQSAPALREYSQRTEKIFRDGSARKHENGVLKYLLEGSLEETDGSFERFKETNEKALESLIVSGARVSQWTADCQSDDTLVSQWVFDCGSDGTVGFANQA